LQHWRNSTDAANAGKRKKRRGGGGKKMNSHSPYRSHAAASRSIQAKRKKKGREGGEKQRKRKGKKGGNTIETGSRPIARRR